ncbi:MAG: secretin N-terminal domain-containing protein, partial [Pirellulales bacterium]
GPGGPQLAGAEGEGSLAPLRFSVDTRTNSIIASGSTGDLTIVEAILLRLDDSDVQERKSAVYRLKNAPSVDVARAVNDFLRSERLVERAAPGGASPFQQIEREVVVVAEPVSNSLILSATPRYFDDIRDLIERLDAQPPQVMIQVLIGEVRLSNTEEFGVELGLQDSILFDRSVLQNISGGVTSTASAIPAGQLAPGYDFNQSQTIGPPSLGNAGTIPSLVTAPLLGTQGVTNFAINRANSELGFGGLVLSASSESVSILVRALRESSRLQVLSRPQVMTLDNQPAFIQVGQRVPRVTNVVSNALTGINSAIELINVGLILGVTPRISPDGTVVMELDAERSALGPISEGIPIAVSPTGIPVLSPRIDTTLAQTTISAADGQTVVLGGLITKTVTKRSRRVPYLSDIPLVGMLFRYDFDQVLRSELLIILTPHVIRNEADANAVKQAEAARISWCLADVERIQGPTGIYLRGESEVDGDGTVVVYPDQDLRGTIDRPVTLPDLIPEGPNLIVPGEGTIIPGEELLVPPTQVPPGMEAPVMPVPMGPVIPGPAGAAPSGAPGLGTNRRAGSPTASAATAPQPTTPAGVMSFGAPADVQAPVYTQVTLGAPRPRMPGSTQFVRPDSLPPAARSSYVAPQQTPTATPIPAQAARGTPPGQRPPVMQGDGRLMVSGGVDANLRPDAGRFLPKQASPPGR